MSIAKILFAVWGITAAGMTYAACTTNSIWEGNKVTICTTCCQGSNCTTTCV